jgi:hypothetical protein
MRTLLRITALLCLAISPAIYGQSSPRPIVIRRVQGEKTPDPAIEQAIRQQIDSPGSYTFNRVDLDGDGVPELLVYVNSPSVCGSGGCTTFIFRKQDAAYKLISSITLTRTPIYVSTTKSNGWRDLIIPIAGGGAREGYAVLAYDGKTYPDNPTVAPAHPLTRRLHCTAYLEGIPKP